MRGQQHGGHRQLQPVLPALAVILRGAHETHQRGEFIVGEGASPRALTKASDGSIGATGFGLGTLHQLVEHSALARGGQDIDVVDQQVGVDAHVWVVGVVGELDRDRVGPGVEGDLDFVVLSGGSGSGDLERPLLQAIDADHHVRGRSRAILAGRAHDDDVVTISLGVDGNFDGAVGRQVPEAAAALGADVAADALDLDALGLAAGSCERCIEDLAGGPLVELDQQGRRVERVRDVVETERVIVGGEDVGGRDVESVEQVSDRVVVFGSVEAVQRHPARVRVGILAARVIAPAARAFALFARRAGVCTRRRVGPGRSRVRRDSRVATAQRKAPRNNDPTHPHQHPHQQGHKGDTKGQLGSLWAE